MHGMEQVKFCRLHVDISVSDTGETESCPSINVARIIVSGVLIRTGRPRHNAVIEDVSHFKVEICLCFDGHEPSSFREELICDQLSDSKLLRKDPAP